MNLSVRVKQKGLKSVTECSKLANVSLSTLYLWDKSEEYKKCLEFAIDRAVKKKGL